MSPPAPAASDAQQEHTSILRTYVNDMIGVEADIGNAVEGQCADSDVAARPHLHRLLRVMADTSVARREALQRHSEELDGKFGGKLKEAVMAAAGTLAGLYGKVRKHPVSRMLRDDVTALNLASTAYGMLYTTALAFNEERLAATVLQHLNDLPAQVKELSAQIPEVIVEELAKDDATVNMDAARYARAAMERAWAGA
jgi:hypothetical protein